MLVLLLLLGRLEVAEVRGRRAGGCENATVGERWDVTDVDAGRRCGGNGGGCRVEDDAPLEHVAALGVVRRMVRRAHRGHVGRVLARVVVLLVVPLVLLHRRLFQRKVLAGQAPCNKKQRWR